MGKQNTLTENMIVEPLNSFRLIPRKRMKPGHRKTVMTPNGLFIKEIWINEVDWEALKHFEKAETIINWLETFPEVEKP